MKKEEKIRMLLHPERYTDEQIERMLDHIICCYSSFPKDKGK